MSTFQHEKMNADSWTKKFLYLLDHLLINNAEQTAFSTVPQWLTASYYL
ncbi:MAG: hypothetical protein LBU34_04715 [Planctomycetaceae bacterium]|nr:hypothetical protein [Planctomycetaceae bacterium]